MARLLKNLLTNPEYTRMVKSFLPPLKGLVRQQSAWCFASTRPVFHQAGSESQRSYSLYTLPPTLMEVEKIASWEVGRDDFLLQTQVVGSTSM